MYSNTSVQVTWFRIYVPCLNERGHGIEQTRPSHDIPTSQIRSPHSLIAPPPPTAPAAAEDEPLPAPTAPPPHETGAGASEEGGTAAARFARPQSARKAPPKLPAPAA